MHFYIYTTDTCKFCNMAKELLEEKALTYTEFDARDPGIRFLLARLGITTVPQIYDAKDGFHFGGYDFFKAWLDETLHSES